MISYKSVYLKEISGAQYISW